MLILYIIGMDINFSNSFFDSLKRIARHNTWYYKTWDFFRSGLPGFIRNLWVFRKCLWNHRWWDWRFTMELMQTSLKEMERGMQEGLEIKETRNKKIYKMRKAIYIMDHFMNDDFIELAEKELGSLPESSLEFKQLENDPDLFEMLDKDTEEQKIHRRKVYARAREIEEKMWIELWETFKGQDYSKFDDKKEWNDQFDGSGMRGWWD